MPGLTLLLDDDDLDVRKGRRGGDQATKPGVANSPTGGGQRITGTRTAVPALVRSVRAADPELRVMAIHTLSGMGNEIAKAAPCFTGAARRIPTPESVRRRPRHCARWGRWLAKPRTTSAARWPTRTAKCGRQPEKRYSTFCEPAPTDEAAGSLRRGRRRRRIARGIANPASSKVTVPANRRPGEWVRP